LAKTSESSYLPTLQEIKMQQIERNELARAQVAGGAGKGTADATATSQMDLNLSGATINGSIDLTLNNGATATATA
jgi:hypothetical protein